MYLTAQFQQSLLDALSVDEITARIEQLHTSDDPVIVAARTRWQELENTPNYIEGEEFRQLHMDTIKQVIDGLYAQRTRDYPNPQITDCYVLTAEASSPHIDGLELPLIACKIYQTVFTYSMTDHSWGTRPWQGEDDPLLSLPYTRKYDHERAAYHHLIEQQLWERLQRAGDLVYMTQRRVQQLDLREHDGQFTYPDLDDVQAELAKDQLTLGIDDIAGMVGQVRVELRQLDERGKPRGASLAEGTYRGAFAGRHVSRSGATFKAMLIEALEDLSNQIYELCELPSSEALEETELASPRDL